MTDVIGVQPMCPVCHRKLIGGEPRCCPVRPKVDAGRHGVKCRRAGIKMAPREAFADAEGYGAAFQRGWMDEDRRLTGAKA